MGARKEKKMKAYKIVTPFNYSQTHIVVAENIGKAEEVFLEEYSPITIETIELVSEYVQIQKEKAINPRLEQIKEE